SPKPSDNPVKCCNPSEGFTSSIVQFPNCPDQPSCPLISPGENSSNPVAYNATPANCSFPLLLINALVSFNFNFVSTGSVRVCPAGIRSFTLLVEAGNDALPNANLNGLTPSFVVVIDVVAFSPRISS